MSETVVSDPPKKRLGKRDYPADFGAAWLAYPTDANMSKPKALAAWQRLDPADRQAMIRAIPAFVAYCKADPTYRPVHMVRFISERRFDGFAGALEAAKVNWLKRLDWARSKRQWSTHEWGPMPGSLGCLAPSNLLSEEDGKGWLDRQHAA